MLKKNIEITNIYGEKETKEMHFNLTRMEIYDLQKKYKEGYQNHIKNVIDSKNSDNMLNIFTELVLSSYCEVNDKGQVVKSQEIRDNFQHSEEYSELMFELLDTTDTKKAENFFKAIVPQQVLQELNKNSQPVNNIVNTNKQ